MTLRKRLFVLVLTVGLLAVGGVATAAWLTSGTGVGSARATTAQSLTVSNAVPAASLYPKPAAGYSSPSTGAVVATVDNPNPFPVDLTTATLGTVTITPVTGKTCANGSVVPTDAGSPIALSPAVRVPANSSGTPVTVPAALEMLATAEDGCQGASISVVLTVNGTVV